MHKFKSFEIVTVAVFLLGGDAKVVDTEDVAVEANRLAPGLFTWKKYKDQISFDHIRRQLIDATEKETGAYLIGSVRRGWQLTENGLKFARDAASRLRPDNVPANRLNSNEQLRQRLDRERIRSTRAFERFLTGNSAEITEQEALAFFRIDDYVPDQVKENKIVRLLNSFDDDPEFSEVVKVVARIARRKK